MVYLNFRSEVLTDELIENLFMQGKKWLFLYLLKALEHYCFQKLKVYQMILELDFTISEYQKKNQ